MNQIYIPFVDEINYKNMSNYWLIVAFASQNLPVFSRKKDETL